MAGHQPIPHYLTMLCAKTTWNTNANKTSIIKIGEAHNTSYTDSCVVDISRLQLVTTLAVTSLQQLMKRCCLI